jgi:hypothetical protein
MKTRDVNGHIAHDQNLSENGRLDCDTTLSVILKMEIMLSSETLVNTHKFKLRYKTEDNS